MTNVIRPALSLVQQAFAPWHRSWRPPPRARIQERVEPDFEAIRREHRAALEAVARLQRACAEEFGDRAEAAGDFISFFETSIEPHMRGEEAQVYPLLEKHLPEDIGSASAMRREHETLRSLVALLRQVRKRLASGDPAAAAEFSVLGQDVALLLREHIRKEDGVLNPLLERILKSVHA